MWDTSTSSHKRKAGFHTVLHMSLYIKTFCIYFEISLLETIQILHFWDCIIVPVRWSSLISQLLPVKKRHRTKQRHQRWFHRRRWHSSPWRWDGRYHITDPRMTDDWRRDLRRANVPKIRQAVLTEQQQHFSITTIFMRNSKYPCLQITSFQLKPGCGPTASIFLGQ